MARSNSHTQCSGILGLEPYATRQIRFRAGQLVGRYGFSGDDREDLEQELYLDLLCRLPRYNPARAGLNTFVARIVDHAVARIIERQKATGRGYRVPKISLDDPVHDDQGDGTPRSEVLDAAAYLRQTGRSDFQSVEDQDRGIALGDAILTLPPDLQELCSLLPTYTVSEISRITGIPRGTLYERLSKIRAHFERAGLRQYL
jgi:RNA polymerase sigma-70 factor (ECF subfamily)